MKDFLRAVFSRGSQNQTFDPLVMVGGVNDSSQSLTTDVLHFDPSGWARVTVMSGGGNATVSITGTQAVNVASWGGITVLSASPGVPTVGWFQRLDRTNDEVTVWNATSVAAAQTNISGTTGSVPVQATNSGRYMVMAVNDSTAVMFLQYGVTAASNAYAVRIPSLGYWEMPSPIWQGSLSAIWDSVNIGAGRFTILS